MKKIVLLLSLFLSVCQAAELKWFNGSVEEAFKLAQDKGRPLFVYWGAVWCPPCNQIKKTIFTKAEFQDEAKNFIALYLDGDAPEAQKWGEHFGTVGYPTMMILSPKAQEIYRMPFGLDVNEYVALMKSVRMGMNDLKTLLAKKDKSELEWGILARHSWEQEKVLTPDFAALAQGCQGNYCERFTLLALSSAIDKEVVTDKEMYRGKLTKLLQDKKNVRQNLGFFSFEADKTIRALFAESEYANISQIWLEAVAPFIDDTQLSLDERLSSLYPRIQVAKLGQQKVSPALQQEINRHVSWIDRAAKDEMERQSVMSTAVYLLMEADLLNEAKKMALTELKKSKSPYYFMSYLSSIEKKLGDEKAALTWSRKAWQNATGSATRFQWGTSYLIGAFSQKGEQGDQVLKDLEVITSEILALPDAFQGRNKARFNRLFKTLRETNSAGLEVMRGQCQRFSVHKAGCEGLLKGQG